MRCLFALPLFFDGLRFVSRGAQIDCLVLLQKYVAFECLVLDAMRTQYLLVIRLVGLFLHPSSGPQCACLFASFLLRR